MKICKKCGVPKPDAEFYQIRKDRPWRFGECRACKIAKERERINRDPERHNADGKRWYSRNKAARRSAVARWYEQHPGSKDAHRMLGNALRRGEVSKATSCARCGSGGRIHGHHSDYSKPLDVEWLCSTCHRAEEMAR